MKLGVFLGIIFLFIVGVFFVWSVQPHTIVDNITSLNKSIIVMAQGRAAGVGILSKRNTNIFSPFEGVVTEGTFVEKGSGNIYTSINIETKDKGFVAVIVGQKIEKKYYQVKDNVKRGQKLAKITGDVEITGKKMKIFTYVLRSNLEVANLDQALTLKMLKQNE